MTYWVVRHDIVDEYLSHSWAGPRRKWRKFDEAHVRKFASKEAAQLEVDTMHPGCLVMQVSDPPVESMGELLPDWYRDRIRAHIENKRQEQHRQGRDD
jgi:hypothetical protein